MPWYVLAYVAPNNKPATVAVMLGPFKSKPDAVTMRTQWLAVDTQHQAMDPWYSDVTGQDAT